MICCQDAGICCHWEKDAIEKGGHYLEDGLPVDGSVVNNHGDRKSPKDRVVVPLPNGRTPWLVNRGTLTTYIHWDDPPSIPHSKCTNSSGDCCLTWGSRIPSYSRDHFSSPMLGGIKLDAKLW